LEAGQFIWDWMQVCLEQARTLAPDHAEGDGPLLVGLAYRLRALAAQLQAKFKFLFVVPCLFAKSHTPEGAKDCLEQMLDPDLADLHEPATNWWKANLVDDLRCVAGGGPITEKHSNQMEMLGDIKLTEDDAEGYHRGSRITKIKGEASTREKIIVTQRQTQNFQRVQNFLEKYKDRGLQVFRYEWVNYKRLLQPPESKRKLWRPMRIATRAFYRKMYRLDDPRRAEWHNLVTKGGKTKPPEQTPRDAVRIEYLSMVLQPSHMYGYERRPRDDTENGPLWTYFQVLQLRTSHNKPKVTKTAAASKDKTMQSSLAVFIQEYDQRQLDEEEVVGQPNGDVEVYPLTTPRWESWTDLAPFDILRKHLQTWRTMEPSTEPGCYWLRGRERAVPGLPITDMNCPTLALVEQLHVKGWRAVEEFVETTAPFGRPSRLRRPRGREPEMVLSCASPATGIISLLPNHTVARAHQLLPMPFARHSDDTEAGGPCLQSPSQ